MNTDSLKNVLIEAAKLLYQRRLVQATGGNISMRADDSDRIWITASNVSLLDTSAENLILVDAEGKKIEGKDYYKPSKETALHTVIYKIRPATKVVFHTHPTYTTGFTVSGSLFPLVTASASLKLRKIVMVKYAPPGSQELMDLISRAVTEAEDFVNVFLLEKHGLITFGQSIKEVFNTTELTEETAKVAFLSAAIRGSFAK